MLKNKKCRQKCHIDNGDDDDYVVDMQCYSECAFQNSPSYSQEITSSDVLRDIEDKFHEHSASVL